MTRFGYVMVTYFSGLAVAVGSCLTVPVKLIWNASASTPIGLYALHAPGDLKPGDLVAVMPPNALVDLMVARRYIARDVPLLKHVAALPGQRICRIHRTITIDGRAVAAVLDRDRMGRVLPVWHGCQRLAPGSLFLLNAAIRDSFDGRYFGPVSAARVIGKATPLYTDEDGHGHFVWRTATAAHPR